MKNVLIYIFALSVILVSCANDTQQAGSNTASTQAKRVPGKVAETAPQKVRKAAPAPHSQTGGLKWYTIEEAVAANKKDPKLLLVDVYTDWCGWCKVMDRKTFTDPAVKSYIEEHFYPIKFNAEQKEPINFNGREYKFVPGGRRGHNQLAAQLLNGRLGYPSFAFLSSDYQSLMVKAGYQKPDQFMSVMKNVVATKS